MIGCWPSVTSNQYQEVFNFNWNKNITMYRWIFLLPISTKLSYCESTFKSHCQYGTFGHDSWKTCKLLQTISLKFSPLECKSVICTRNVGTRSADRIHGTTQSIHIIRSTPIELLLSHDTIVFLWNLICIILQDCWFTCGALNWRFWKFNYFENLYFWHPSMCAITYIKSHAMD